MDHEKTGNKNEKQSGGDSGCLTDRMGGWGGGLWHVWWKLNSSDSKGQVCGSVLATDVSHGATAEIFGFSRSRVSGFLKVPDSRPFGPFTLIEPDRFPGISKEHPSFCLFRVVVCYH